MSRGKYAPEFRTKLVLEVLRGEQELGAIVAEHNLNPNILRNWKAEFLAHASSAFEEREAKRKEAAVKKERDKMLKTIGQLTIERNFIQNCFRAVGQPILEFDVEDYNHLRPHEALGYATPDEVYHTSFCVALPPAFTGYARPVSVHSVMRQ